MSTSPLPVDNVPADAPGHLNDAGHVIVYGPAPCTIRIVIAHTLPVAVGLLMVTVVMFSVNVTWKLLPFVISKVMALLDELGLVLVSP